MNEKGKDLNLSVLASKALHAKKQESMKEARRLLIDAGFKIPVVQSYEPTQSPSQSRDSATNEVPCSTPQDTIIEDDVWGKLEDMYKRL